MLTNVILCVYAFSGRALSSLVKQDDQCTDKGCKFDIDCDPGCWGCEEFKVSLSFCKNTTG